MLIHLGTVSEKLKATDRYCVRTNGLEDVGKGLTKYIADHAIVFMLRGINQKWKQPICFYFVKSPIKTPDLKRIIKNTIRTVHNKTKLKILATVSEQGSSNQSVVHQLSNESGYRREDVMFEIDGETIVHIFDVPHLFKCLRNHFMSKDIYFGNKIAKWNDLQTVYHIDGENPVSKVCPKLTERHLNPIGKHKMKVKYATQILVDPFMQHYVLPANAKLYIYIYMDTADFILFMNNLFDSLNGVRTSTPLKRPLSDRSSHFQIWDEAQTLLKSLKFKKVSDENTDANAIALESSTRDESQVEEICTESRTPTPDSHRSDDAPEPQLKRKGITIKNSALRLLQEKQNNEMKIRERELCLEEKKLKLEEQKLHLEEQRFNLDKQEREHHMEIAKQQQGLLSFFIKKM
ncbi:thap domain-containing protein 9 [Holotrichia oblita]|uniref:Thap domain-containing protein 9 n=1 Tax=Holotrichia oblita TaxID=644536 RepID=A0ACB9SHQ7_HOLOL|nr:thap domain-containing protein 9 [Holotrichia oblita]